MTECPVVDSKVLSHGLDRALAPNQAQEERLGRELNTAPHVWGIFTLAEN